MTPRTLITQMLNALEYHQLQTRPIHNTELVIEAAREYLAAPEPASVTQALEHALHCAKMLREHARTARHEMSAEALEWLVAYVRSQPKAPEQEPTDSMGIPLSCGKPLCAPGAHHPLCTLAAPEQSELGYATRLAEAIYKQHYKDDAPEWKPLPDLMGVLTQIDNMFADLYTHPAHKAPEPAELSDEEILAANHPDGVENGETIRCPDYELIAFGRQVLAAQGAKAHG